MDNNNQNPPDNPSQPAQGLDPQPQTDTPSQIQPTFNPPISPSVTPLDQPAQPLSTPPATQPPAPPLPSQPTWQMPSDQPSGNLSTLDNPWGAPAQPPPIDSSSTPPLTFPPAPQPQVETAPQSSFETSQTPTTPTDLSTLASTPAPKESTVSESAPTDLSHLIGNNPPPENNTPPQQAETLVAPSVNAGPDVPASPQEERKGIPKWLIGVGIGLFLLVAGASAYFILGIGRPPDTTSIPATQAPKTTQQVKPPAPLPTPISQPAATGSASFDQLQGGSSGGQQATSAADLLRQRQQGR